MPRKSCVRGVRVDGKCKKKPGPKKSKSCVRGVRADGKCKKKPGPKRSRSRSLRRIKSRSPVRSLREDEFYCVSCKKRQLADDIVVESDKRGKPRMVGYDKYGHVMFKYVSFAKADELAYKFNQ